MRVFNNVSETHLNHNTHRRAKVISFGRIILIVKSELLNPLSVARGQKLYLKANFRILQHIGNIV